MQESRTRGCHRGGALSTQRTRPGGWTRSGVPASCGGLRRENSGPLSLEGRASTSKHSQWSHPRGQDVAPTDDHIDGITLLKRQGPKGWPPAAQQEWAWEWAGGQALNGREGQRLDDGQRRARLGACAGDGEELPHSAEPSTMGTVGAAQCRRPRARGVLMAPSPVSHRCSLRASCSPFSPQPWSPDSK